MIDKTKNLSLSINFIESDLLAIDKLPIELISTNFFTQLKTFSFHSTDIRLVSLSHYLLEKIQFAKNKQIEVSHLTPHESCILDIQQLKKLNGVSVQDISTKDTCKLKATYVVSGFNSETTEICKDLILKVDKRD